jgi:hypothetical protein
MLTFINQNIYVLALFNLGFFMAIMHAVMTRNSFQWIDIALKVRWFGKDSWTNKHTWSFLGRQGLFKYWPLIIFTDLFHLAHALFAINLAIILSLLIPNTNLYSLCLLFFIYSGSFELFYGIIFNKKEPN